MPYIVDAAWQRPTPGELITAEYSGIMGYVSQDTGGKNLTKPEIDAYHARGLDVGINYEFNPKSALGGAAQGEKDAAFAVRMAEQLGVPQGVCIWFSVDWDVTPAQKPAVLAYANAVYDLCSARGYRAGIYASYWVCLYLSSYGYKGMYWQTYAWSGGNWFGNAQLRQIQNNITVGSSNVDRNQVMTSDWGQWTAGGKGMEQKDQVQGNLARANSIGNLFADAGNFRDWFYLPPNQPGNNPPPVGSRADIMFKAAQQITTGTITQEMLNAAVAASAEAIGAAMAVEFAKHVRIQ